MNKHSLLLIGLLLPLWSLSPGGGPYKRFPAKVVYTLNKQQSKMAWTGMGEIGSYSIKGNISPAQGAITLSGLQVLEGQFTVNMNSITCSSLSGMSKVKLVNHLKSEDFFDVAKYPTATFVLSSATLQEKDTYNVSGKLTIKGNTQPVVFPASIRRENNRLLINADITVDRSRFDVRYGSSNFFDNLGEHAIKNEFYLKLELIATAEEL